ISIPALERTVDTALARIGDVQQIESYDEYLLVSRAKFLLIPTGRWDLLAPILTWPECSSGAGNRLVWLEVVAGTALRRGDLGSAGALLRELKHDAIASEEPQRILPMAGVVLPWAALSGDHTTAAEVADTILGLRGQTLWALHAPPTIPRSFAQIGDIDSLRRFADHVGAGTTADQVRITSSTAH